MKSSETDKPPYKRLFSGQGQTFASFRHRNFKLYFFGQLVSNAGTWMQIIAQSWLVYQISHSEWVLGVVGFAAAIPSLGISPFAGVIIDRVERRSILIFTQTISMLLAFVLAWLTFINQVKEWHIVALAILLGAVNALDAPTRQSFVIDMVGREDVPNAIALNSLMFNGARVIGPAVGGLLLASLGAAWCFTINGLSFVAVIISLLMMRLPALKMTGQTASPWQEMVSGVRYASQHRNQAALIWLSFIFSFFAITYTTLLPAFVEKSLNQGAAAYGVVTAFSGIGAVIGALLLAAQVNVGQRGRWLFLINIFYPLVLAGFAFSRFFPLSLLLAVGLGFGFMLCYTTMNTLLQLAVDDQYRGRVMSLYTLTFMAFSPFGNLLIGALGEWFDLSMAMVFFAACSLVLTMFVFWKAPEVRQMP